MKLELVTKLAKEYSTWSAGQLSPGVPQTKFVSWVDTREVAYHTLRNHWNNHGPKLLWAAQRAMDHAHGFNCGQEEKEIYRAITAAEEVEGI